MNLSTEYMGLKLAHPLIAGASPISHDLGMVRRLEDAGAAAIVMHSMFEEQITRDSQGMLDNIEVHADSFAEAQSYLPTPPDFVLGPEQYLQQIRRIKEAVSLPVIGSLNGTTASGWLEYSRLIEQAGADGLELNVYYVPTDPAQTGTAVEQRLLDIVKMVKPQVKIPVAVKLSPFYSSIANLGRQLDQLGVAGLVLFNRFYQPDIDVEALEAVPSLRLSESSDLLLRLRWLAILSGKVKASLGVSGGVRTSLDAVKAVMAGADAVQLVAALLEHGPEHLWDVRDGMVTWMEEHEYESLAQLKGSMNHQRCPDPSAYERVNYMRVLRGWKG
jgi:dihydroorotate dehydrogenase (fumarate)